MMMSRKAYNLLFILVVHLLACHSTLPTLPEFEGAEVSGTTRVDFSWNGIPVQLTAEGECTEEACTSFVCASILGFQKCEEFVDSLLDN